MTAVVSGARNGVYRCLRATERAQLPGALRCVVDLAGAHDKRGLLAAFVQGLQFPADFGWNWDALADCLQDLSWLRAEGIIVEIRAAAALVASAGADWRTALDILRDAASYWKRQKRTFIVLIEGADALPEWVS